MALVALHAEVDALMDVVPELAAIHQALTHRHGEAFRKLERDVERLVDGDIDVVMHDLGDGRLSFAPGPKVTDLLRRARAMSVI
jgi:hypothetical protein